MVYLIHFETPFKHAKHYIGFAHEGNLEKRINHHKNGTGSRLMRAVTLAGIPGPSSALGPTQINILSAD